MIGTYFTYRQWWIFRYLCSPIAFFLAGLPPATLCVGFRRSCLQSFPFLLAPLFFWLSRWLLIGGYLFKRLMFAGCIFCLPCRRVFFCLQLEGRFFVVIMFLRLSAVVFRSPMPMLTYSGCLCSFLAFCCLPGRRFAVTYAYRRFTLRSELSCTCRRLFFLSRRGESFRVCVQLLHFLARRPHTTVGICCHRFCLQSFAVLICACFFVRRGESFRAYVRLLRFWQNGLLLLSALIVTFSCRRKDPVIFCASFLRLRWCLYMGGLCIRIAFYC